MGALSKTESITLWLDLKESEQRETAARGEDDEMAQGHIIRGLVGHMKNTKLSLKSQGNSWRILSDSDLLLKVHTPPSVQNPAKALCFN